MDPSKAKEVLESSAKPLSRFDLFYMTAVSALASKGISLRQAEEMGLDHAEAMTLKVDQRQAQLSAAYQKSLKPTVDRRQTTKRK